MPGLIKLFFNEIKNQSSTFICVFRTDNALEYVKNDVSLFYSKNEIIHQTSYSHTSQQNGVAERKHRRVLHVARIMMIHMHVPKCLLSDLLLVLVILLIGCMYLSFMLKFYFPVFILTKVSFHYSSYFWLYVFCSGLVSWFR